MARPTEEQIATFKATYGRFRSRTCVNIDGTPKRRFRTRRAANRKRLKWQRVYACAIHGFHLTAQPRADTASAA